MPRHDLEAHLQRGLLWTPALASQPPTPCHHHHTFPGPLLTSTSHRALELVAEVADCRPVVLRKTCCFFLCSSHVRNFSCSAWKSLTTSPCMSMQDGSKRKMSLKRKPVCCPEKSRMPKSIQLTPFKMSSLLSLHFMKRTIFQLVLQLTELT